MIKKDITFKDFDGNEVTEVHYFHLSKSELISMELATDGGMSAKMNAIIKSGNGGKIIDAFNAIIRSAYGQRDPANPTRFYKAEKLTDEFMGSLAFDALFTELLTDPSSAAVFVNGLVPADLASTPEMVQAIVDAGLPDPNNLDTGGVWPRGAAPRKITDVNLETASIGAEVLEPGNIMASVTASGLKDPLGHDREYLPWAFRNPTDKELIMMTRAQLLDVTRRQGSGWTPPSSPPEIA
jgi:hypothetical protein